MQRITSADEWMSRLQISTNAIWEKLPPLWATSSKSNVFGPSESRPKRHVYRPIRLAVIDTGAAIESSILEDLYDNRLVECRSWIGKNSATVVKDAAADRVGHGTHAASLALKVTENTSCEIYVAQVFDRSPVQEASSKNDMGVVAEAIARVGLQTKCFTLTLANLS
jgi:hypothetical protein